MGIVKNVFLNGIKAEKDKLRGGRSWYLVWLITRRSGVRVPLPLLNRRTGGFYSKFDGKSDNYKNKTNEFLLMILESEMIQRSLKYGEIA